MSLSAIESYPDHPSPDECTSLQATIDVLETEIDNLKIALKSARTIGIALGIVMAARKITPDEAFEVLRVASQHSHRKLRDVAYDVGLTGIVPEPGTREPVPPGPQPPQWRRGDETTSDRRHLGTA